MVPKTMRSTSEASTPAASSAPDEAVSSEATQAQAGARHLEEALQLPPLQGAGAPATAQAGAPTGAVAAGPSVPTPEPSTPEERATARLEPTRRERVQPFPQAGMLTLTQIEEACARGDWPPLLGPAEVLPQLRQVSLDSHARRHLLHGQSIQVPGADYGSGELLVLLGPAGEFLGLGQGLGGAGIAPKRLVAAAP